MSRISAKEKITRLETTKVFQTKERYCLCDLYQKLKFDLMA